LTCVCSKAPKSVQWYLNGYPLPINERYQTKIIDREIQLTINNVQELDIGTITCCLNNTITTANLTLDDDDKTLKFIKLLEDDDTGNIQVDSPFMLECRTNRPTYQIRWFKDNREISQYDLVMKTISDGCTHVLQVSFTLFMSNQMRLELGIVFRLLNETYFLMKIFRSWIR